MSVYTNMHLDNTNTILPQQPTTQLVLSTDRPPTLLLPPRLQKPPPAAAAPPIPPMLLSSRRLEGVCCGAGHLQEARACTKTCGAYLLRVAEFYEMPALIPSEIRGVLSSKQDERPLAQDEFKSRLRRASGILASCNAVHGNKTFRTSSLLITGVYLSTRN